MPEGEVVYCQRLQGHSASVCLCRLQGGGWLPCPETARGRLISTYPPAAYVIKEKPVAKPKPQQSNKSSAISAGYTGSICDQCGSTRMRRAGTCEVCDDCYATGGCG
jgi:hypothetical protein